MELHTICINLGKTLLHLDLARAAQLSCARTLLAIWNAVLVA
jgi:hypothetical protein